MSMKQIIKDYFNFTRRERIGVISLVILLAVIFFLPKLTSPKNKFEDFNADTAWLSTMRKLDKNSSDSIAGPEVGSSFEINNPQREINKEAQGNPPPKLFDFNPNTISADDWKQLGIKEKTIHTILNYLSKGGSFKKPQDLQKIYGLPKPDYERLLPYVKIEFVLQPAAQRVPEENKPETKSFNKSAYRHSIIELNNTDTTTLIDLPGIGSKLANRIISFRDKLGGFYSVEQVKETYGLQDSVFQKIKQYLSVNSNSIKKININTVTLDELKQHPYFRFTIANPVILYRNEHGKFSKTEDVKKVMAVTAEVFNKISPYISIQ
jgi:competence protein ComEA